MATAKTTTLFFRIESNLKDALRTAANDHRFITNMIGVMIREHCARAGVHEAGWSFALPGRTRSAPWSSHDQAMSLPRPGYRR